MKSRILICDDNESVRNLMRFLLEAEDEFIIAGEAESGIQASEVCRMNCPDLILLDINMDSPNTGLNTVSTLRIEHPNLKIIMLTVYDDEFNIVTAFRNGADNYIVKSLPPQEMLSIIRATLHGKAGFSAQVSEAIKSYLVETDIKTHEHYISTLKAITKLTPTEIVILQMAREGSTRRDISNQRYIEFGTVKTHINNILKKFEKHNIQKVIEELEECCFFEYIDKINT